MEQHEPTDRELQEQDLAYLTKVFPLVCQRIGWRVHIEDMLHFPPRVNIRLMAPRGDTYDFVLLAGSVYSQWTIESHGQTYQLASASISQLMRHMIGCAMAYEIVAITLEMP